MPKTLFILNDPPYGTERSYNGLRLAGALAKRDGEEVVQLYVRDIAGSVTRPLKELKGFRKILLKAGESKEVEFTIGMEELSFYRADMSYGPEPGKFIVFVGGNSRDVKQAEFILR